MRVSRVLVGLVIAAAFIGVALGAVAVIAYPGYRAAQKKVAMNRVRTFSKGLGDFAAAHAGQCPAMTDELVTGGYVAKNAVRDPWGTDITYSCSATGRSVRSAGLDRVFDTVDDLTSSQ